MSCAESNAATAAAYVENLMRAGMGGVWIVDVSQVDLDDLINARPHSIIRTTSTDAVRFIATDTQGLEGCVAGWISEGEGVEP